MALGWDEPTRELIKAQRKEVDEMVFTGGGAEHWGEEFPCAKLLPWLSQDAMAGALGYV